MTRPDGQTIGKAEFIAMMAMMFATIAFSIDSLMPVLPSIATDLGLTDTAQAASVMMAFVVGMGLGTVVMGPLSDAWGRKRLVYLGLAVYVLGAGLSYLAGALEWMLAARVLQGLGAAGPRVVSMAIIRDSYDGRQMASVMSLTMMVFLLVPGVAPLMGAVLADTFGWRSIFGAYLTFAAILLIWFGGRMSETLAIPDRRPLRAGLIASALGEMVRHPVVRLSMIVQTLMMIVLFSVLTMVQPIFDVAFDRGATMPQWFGAIAVTSGLSSLLNARLVLRFGMRRLVTWALVAQILVSGAFVGFLIFGLNGAFAFFVVWLFGVMFQGGLTVANLNAIALEPMGHIAGTATSMIGAVSTMIAALFASGLAHLFDGTPLPLIQIVFVASIAGVILMQQMRRAETVVA